MTQCDEIILELLVTLLKKELKIEIENVFTENNTDGCNCRFNVYKEALAVFKC